MNHDCVQVGVDAASGLPSLLSLPVLLEGHRPDAARLPALVLALARDVEWGEEKACFRGLAKVRGQEGLGGAGKVVQTLPRHWPVLIRT